MVLSLANDGGRAPSRFSLGAIRNASVRYRQLMAVDPMGTFTWNYTTSLSTLADLPQPDAVQWYEQSAFNRN